MPAAVGDVLNVEFLDVAQFPLMAHRRHHKLPCLPLTGGWKCPLGR